MPTMKVFHEDTQNVGSADYCVSGLHVHLKTFLGRPVSREVTPCDGACQANQPVREAECDENVVTVLREKLGTGVEQLSFQPVM